MVIKRIYSLTAATFLLVFLSTFSHASPLPTDPGEAASPTAATAMPREGETLATTKLNLTASTLWANPFDSILATANDPEVKSPGILNLNPLVPGAPGPLPAQNPQTGKTASSSSGEKTHFELQGMAQWKNIMSSGSLSTAQNGSFGLSTALKIGDMKIGPLLRFIWIPEKKIMGAENKIWIDYGQIDRSSTNIVATSFIFLGNVYTVNTSVVTEFANKQFKVGYSPRWGNDKFRIGPSFVVERLTVNISLIDTNTPPTPSASASLNVPNPVVLIGVDFDYTPNRKFALYGNAGAVPCCGGGWHIFDSEWGAKVYFGRTFGVMGGIRYANMRRDFSAPATVVNGTAVGPFSGSLKFPGFGPFVGVSARF